MKIKLPILLLLFFCFAITSYAQATDRVVVKGNPAANISDIERVEIVFKDGVGYDSEKLIQSVQGLVGIR
jgi:hypothetical protein